MQGVRRTSRTPNWIRGLSGTNWKRIPTTSGMTTKFAASRAVRKRRLASAWRSSASGTCRKVANSMSASAGLITASSAAAPGSVSATSTPTATAAKYTAICCSSRASRTVCNPPNLRSQSPRLQRSGHEVSEQLVGGILRLGWCGDGQVDRVGALAHIEAKETAARLLATDELVHIGRGAPVIGEFQHQPVTMIAAERLGRQFSDPPNALLEVTRG